MSISVTLNQIAEWLGLAVAESVAVNGVSTDTRTVSEGNLFVALRGPNFDGNAFVEQAAAKGAVAAIVDRSVGCGIPVLVVPDTLRALQHVATRWRQSLDFKVAAITGSNGKTSVKEMIASILSQEADIGVTQGNLNNHIGVPLTLLNLSRQQRFAVVEMGANHIGEIAELTQLAQPDVALVTNIGNAHLEGFGSLDGVAQGKSEIFKGLSPGGVAVMKADQHWTEGWKAHLPAGVEVLTFGKNTNADVRVHGTVSADGWHVVFHTPQGDISGVLPLLGQHNLCNAAAAVAVSLALGVSHDSIVNGLASLMPVAGRLCLQEASFGGVLIDDTYNANPSSFQAAINVLSQFDRRQKILVMGPMAELGERSKALHAGVGAYAKEMGIDILLGVGEATHAALEAFGSNGLVMENHCGAVHWLLDHAGDRSTVLVKGSRSAEMERVVKGVSGAKTKMCGGA